MDEDDVHDSISDGPCMVAFQTNLNLPFLHCNALTSFVGCGKSALSPVEFRRKALIEQSVVLKCNAYPYTPRHLAQLPCALSDGRSLQDDDIGLGVPRGVVCLLASLRRECVRDC